MNAREMEHATERIALELGREAAAMFVPPFPVSVETMPVKAFGTLEWVLKFHTSKGTATVSGSFPLDLDGADDAIEFAIRKTIRAEIVRGMNICPDARDRAEEFRTGEPRHAADPPKPAAPIRPKPPEAGRRVLP